MLQELSNLNMTSSHAALCKCSAWTHKDSSPLHAECLKLLQVTAALPNFKLVQLEMIWSLWEIYSFMLHVVWDFTWQTWNFCIGVKIDRFPHS